MKKDLVLRQRALAFSASDVVKQTALSQRATASRRALCRAKY